MASLAEISTKAKQRTGNNPGFAGDVTPQEAWDLLTEIPESRLVDVRTEAEWQFVGVPNLDTVRKKPVFLSLLHYPGMTENKNFAPMLERSIVNKETPLLFLCRTGGRSTAAAKMASEMGYTHAFNIAGGFEGDHNEVGHRSNTNGWRAEGLPWQQA